MEELLKLMQAYNSKHDTELCIRMYDDGSGIFTASHSEECDLGDDNCIRRFNNIDQLKQFLQS